MSFGLLKKSEPDKVQRRSQESRLRRGIYNLMQPREEEATYYHHRGDKSSQRNQRSLRQVRDEQPVSKVLSKSYTANPVANGKDEDCISKDECRTRTTGRVHRQSSQTESRDRVQGKTEAATSRIREVKCFKCQGQGHYANECTNKKIDSKATTPPTAFVEKEFGFVQEDSLDLEGAGQNVQEEEVIEKSDHEDVLAIQEDLHTILVAEKEESMDNLDSFEKCDESISQSRRYSLSTTRNPYISDFELLEEVNGDNKLLSVQYECEIQEVEHVDFVFGDAAFCKPERKARICDFMIQGNGEQTQCFDILVNKGDILDFSRNKSSKIRDAQRKHGISELVMENGFSKLFSFDHYMFLKGLKLRDFRKNHLHSLRECIEVEVRRHGPIVDKVKDGRRVIEVTILDVYGVLFEPRMHKARRALQVLISSGVIKLPKLRCLKLMKCLSHPFDPGIKI